MNQRTPSPPFKRMALPPGPPAPAFGGVIQRQAGGTVAQRSSLFSWLFKKSDPIPTVAPQEAVVGRHATNPRFGVGETIDLSMAGTPATGKAFKWRASIGTLTVNGMHPTRATLTIPDVDRTGTKLRLSIVEGMGMNPADWSEVWNKEYDIVRPSDGCVYVEVASNFGHVQNTPSGGFVLDCYLMDTDVSFMNVEIKEKGGLFHGDGCLSYLSMVQHPHSLNWFPGQRRVLAKGTFFTNDRSARVIDPASIDAGKFPNEHNNIWTGLATAKIGTAYRDIEWWYRLRGSVGDGTLIQTVRLETSVYGNGKLYHRKGTASRFIDLGAVNDP